MAVDPHYTPLPMPFSVTASPIRNTTAEGIPIIRVEKETGGNERKCTDIRCLLIFVVFLLVAGYFAIEALLLGSIGRLTRGINSNGGLCGTTASGLNGYPYLYYPLDPTSSSPRLLSNARKCVRVCPTNDDVLSHRVVPIIRSQFERTQRGISSSFLEYTVNTPVYATFPIYGKLCFPVDVKLANQLSQDVLRKPLAVFRAATSSIVNGCSVILGVTIFSFFLGFGYTCLFKTMPRLIIVVAATVTLWAGAILGIALLAASSHSALSVEVPLGGTTKTIWIWPTPFDPSSSFFTGLILLFGSIGLAIVLFLNKDLINISCRVNEAVAEILWSRPNGGLLASPSVAAIGSAILAAIWVFIFTLLSGASTNLGIPQPLSTNRNGSSIVLSLERQDRLPLWAVFGLLVWSAAGFWIFEFVLSLLKFSVCYTATMWYFVEEPDAFETPNPARLTPSLVALSIGLLNHSGSFAAAGVWFGLTRLCRGIRAWTNSRYYRYILPRSQEATPLTKMGDLLSSNAFVEMAVQSTSLNTSLKAARSRGLQRGSASARLIGATSVGSGLSISAIALLSGLISFSILSKNPDYATPTSRHYVASPLFATFIAMIFSIVVVVPHVDCWSVLSDALLYCYLLESESAGGLDEDPTTKVHAPIPLRDLVCEETQLWVEPI